MVSFSFYLEKKHGIDFKEKKGSSGNSINRQPETMKDDPLQQIQPSPKHHNNNQIFSSTGTSIVVWPESYPATSGKSQTYATLHQRCTKHSHNHIHPQWLINYRCVCSWTQTQYQSCGVNLDIHTIARGNNWMQSFFIKKPQSQSDWSQHG